MQRLLRKRGHDEILYEMNNVRHNLHTRVIGVLFFALVRGGYVQVLMSKVRLRFGHKVWTPHHTRIHRCLCLSHCPPPPPPRVPTPPNHQPTPTHPNTHTPTHPPTRTHTRTHTHTHSHTHTRLDLSANPAQAVSTRMKPCLNKDSPELAV